MGVSGYCHARPRFTAGKGPPVPTVQEGVWWVPRAGLDTQATGNILCSCWVSDYAI
jgi:hypothetical protein